jgi:hypothetical protein
MKIFKIILLVSIVIIVLTSCTASCEREFKSLGSNLSGGLDRIVNIYSYDGKLLNTVEGKIDIQIAENKVLFDLNGKRYIYYNSVVEVIEK